MSYLLNYNPGTPQYTYPRRGGAKLSGTCIIHTAECAIDLDGDDSSAEVCASFIANRADYGSYHRLVDSDSIIDMLPWEYEAWQDSETNNWAVGISAAVQAGRWLEIPAARRDRIYRNMAAAAAEFVRHMASKGITVPLRRISGAEARKRVPGFCAHGDSGLHRSDPGTQFDWALFFNYTAQALAGGIQFQSGTTITPLDLEEGFLMALSEDEQRRILAAADMALDTPGRPNPARLLNSADGGYLVALLEGVSGKVGNTLNKEDGGYIVGLVSALKPGAQDADAIANAVIAAVGEDLAKQVAAKLTITVGVE